MRFANLARQIRHNCVCNAACLAVWCYSQAREIAIFAQFRTTSGSKTAPGSVSLPPLRMAGHIPLFGLKLDPLSSAENSHLFGEEGGGLLPIIAGAESRLQLNIDRQSIARPRLSEVALLLGVIGSLLAIAFLIPRPQLQSHPRCGLTTGGQVCASFRGSLFLN